LPKRNVPFVLVRDIDRRMIKETYKITCKQCNDTWLWTPFIWKVAPPCKNGCVNKKGDKVQSALVSFDPVKIVEVKEVEVIIYE